MRETVFFIGRWATNIALVCLAIATSVKPEDAMSNLSGWATKFNLPDPAWLQSHTADNVVFWVALSGAFTLWIGPTFWRKRHSLLHREPRKQAETTQAELEVKIADNPELAEWVRAAAREGLKSQDILVEEGIRPSIKLKFLRGRGFYHFFAGPPFLFYRAKRRLEFIDSWRWFFQEHDKVIIPDLSNERSIHKAKVAIAMTYMTNQIPEEIYYRCMRPDDVRMEIEARILPSGKPA